MIAGQRQVAVAGQCAVRHRHVRTFLGAGVAIADLQRPQHARRRGVEVGDRPARTRQVPGVDEHPGVGSRRAGDDVERRRQIGDATAGDELQRELGTVHAPRARTSAPNVSTMASIGAATPRKWATFNTVRPGELQRAEATVDARLEEVLVPLRDLGHRPRPGQCPEQGVDVADRHRRPSTVEREGHRRHRADRVEATGVGGEGQLVERRGADGAPAQRDGGCHRRPTIKASRATAPCAACPERERVDVQFGDLGVQIHRRAAART